MARGLIKYTSDNSLNDRPTRLLKPKNIGYALVLMLTIAMLGWSIANRAALDAVVEQIRQPLSVQLSDEIGRAHV